MKVLLVDDEELQLLRLENACKSVLPDSEFFVFFNPLKALDNENINKIDLAFLDIEMSGLNGIQLAKRLKSINPLIKIIFVTAYDNYALDAYKLHASGYVTKPVSKEKIKEEIDELSKTIELKNTKKIQIKCFGNLKYFTKVSLYHLPIKNQKKYSLI